MYAARMAYCGQRGIPLSQFLAWPESDQLAALAWQVHESQRCSCGVHEYDTDGTWTATTVHCPGHAALGAEQARQQGAEHGLVTRLVRR